MKKKKVRNEMRVEEDEKEIVCIVDETPVREETITYDKEEGDIVLFDGFDMVGFTLEKVKQAIEEIEKRIADG